jgi:predicted DNA-binding transcriptional regulator AlpA
MQADGLLSIQDVSRLLRISVGTLRAWRRSHEGPHSFKVGRQIRYRPESIERWIRERERKEAKSA